MRRKICILASCVLLAGCSSSGEGTLLFTTAPTIEQITQSDIELPPESMDASTNDSETAEETASEIVETEGSLEPEETENTDESADNSETTVAVETNPTTENTVETTTVEPTTEEPTTAKPQVTEIQAELLGNHYIGTSLTAADFNIILSFDDGSTVNNPAGWYAQPLELSGQSNDITVGYVDPETGKSVTTVITVSAETVPETQPPQTQAPVAVPEPTPVTGNIVETNTTLYTYDMMAADLVSLAASYPDRLSASVAGYTADGRGIYKAVFGNPGASRQIFICAATHAREYMTCQLVMRQLEYYCMNYDTGSYNGQTFRQIFENTCFVVVPMVNPDGVSISQLGEAGLRDPNLRANLAVMYNRDIAEGTTSDSYDRYLVRWKANGRGVDLNRNFSPGWETVANKQPSTTLYKGTEPGSEAESQVLMNAINSMSNPMMAISYHSYGDLVYYQYGQSEPLYSANQALAQNICNLTGHYMAGYSNEAGFSNWCNLVKGIRSVTVETGQVPAPLPLDQLSLLWRQHQNTWVMLATIY